MPKTEQIPQTSGGENPGFNEFLRYFNKVRDPQIRAYICDLVSAVAKADRGSPAERARCGPNG